MRTISVQSVNPYFDESKKQYGPNEVVNIMDYLWKKECNGVTNYINLFGILGPKFAESFADWNRFLYDSEKSFNAQPRFVKCTKTSIELLEQGHHKFKVENWSGALESYNQSLCFAEAGSDNECLAYAGRSACFFSMELYGKAMSDIEMALQTKQLKRNSPIMQRLEYRRDECFKRIQFGLQPDISIPKLSYPADAEFPCMANVLEIQENEKYGRHIVAKRDISVGKIVMVSRVYASGTITATQQCCCICNKTEQNLIACKRCSNTMFCRGTCLDQKGVHQLECKSIYHTVEDSTMKLSIKTLLMAIEMFPDVKSLMAFVDKLINDTSLPNSAKSPKARYGIFLKLAAFLDEERILPAYQVYTVLLSIPKVRRLFDSSRMKFFLMHLTLHHLTVIPQNAFRHERFKRDWIKTDYLYDIMSLINHSCAPNLFNHSISDDIGYCIAVRPIRKGEQLFINYLGNQCKESKSHRKKALKTWGFECTCDRCVSKMDQKYFRNECEKMKSNPSLMYVLEYCQKSYCKASNTELGYRRRLKEECKQFLQEFGHLVWSPEINFVTHCYTLH